MGRNLLDVGALLVKKLNNREGFADFFHERTNYLSVNLQEGRVEKLSHNLVEGASLRCFDGVGVFSSNASLPDEATLKGLLAALPKVKSPAPVDFSPVHTVRPAFKKPLTKLSTSAKLKLLFRADKTARAIDKRIVQVNVIYREYNRSILVANSLGTLVDEEQAGLYVAVEAVARDRHGAQTAFESVGGSLGLELFDEISPEELAEISARRALSLLKAGRAPGGPMPVVLSSSAGGTMIHEAVGHGLEADLIAEGQSVYQGKTGTQVASPKVSVFDDPTIAQKRGSYSFDDEGIPARRTLLIEDGVLKGSLQSLLTAKKTGASPTGNGRRESYAHPPIPRMSNTCIAPGTDDPAAIVRDTHSGLFVTRMGGGEVDTLTGDFVFEVAEGFLIRGGEVAEPVRGLTIAGNGPSALMSIDMVGADLGFGLGTCGKDGQGVPVADAQPTLRIPQLLVGSV